MGLFEKLFGKKKPAAEPKHVEQVEQPEEITKTEILKEDARNITLEEVEKDLETLEKVEPAVQPASASEKVYHIKPHDKGWQLITEDAVKATRVFQYQKEAIQYAKDEGLTYVLYRADGTVRE